MRESDLTTYAVEFARRRNLAPVLEMVLPCWWKGAVRRRPVDCVAWDANRIAAIEFKSALSPKAIEQSKSCQPYANECWVLCHRCTDGSVELARNEGVGVLMPDSDGSCAIVQEPSVSVLDPAKAHVWREQLGHAPTKELAGVRANGDGIASEREAVIEWLGEHSHYGWIKCYRECNSTARDWQELRQRHRKEAESRLGRKIRGG